MSLPIGLDEVKSKGVPFTSAICPVGIRPASTGVYLSALICISWFKIVESVPADKL